MNYFAHGRAYVDDRYFLAGTAVPDWLSVVDRRVRARSAGAAPLVDDSDPQVAAVARGIVQHHHDDGWFHQTRAFAELSWEFTVLVRDALPPDDGLRPSFLGHILVELLLDAALIEEQVDQLDAYYKAVDEIDAKLVQSVVNRIATRSTEHLALLIPRFSAERFLYDYLGRCQTALPLESGDATSEAAATARFAARNISRRPAPGEPAQRATTNCIDGECIMKFGMNLLLWTGEVNDGLIPVLESLKAMGYDGVELPLFNYDLDYAAWGKRLDDLGLERTAVTVRTEEDNPISPDAAIRAKGVKGNKRAVDCAAAAGATHLVGPYHSALGHFTGQGPSSDEWKWGVESMRPVAEHAGSAGVTLGVEALNRFECYLLNSHGDSARFAREVDHPNCRVMYDTFHANIEEKNIAQAIRDCSDVLCHVHISENDRSTPGSGNVRWAENFETLKEVGYDGWLMIEAFGLALPELVAATKIWRRMYESEEQLARDGLAFMKEQWG